MCLPFIFTCSSWKDFLWQPHKSFILFQGKSVGWVTWLPRLEPRESNLLRGLPNWKLGFTEVLLPLQSLFPLPASWDMASWATFWERQAQAPFRIAWHYFLSSHISHMFILFLILFSGWTTLFVSLWTSKRSLYAELLQRGNDYGIVYLFYYGTIEVTLVLESVPVTHDIFSDVFWPLLLSIFSHL